VSSVPPHNNTTHNTHAHHICTPHMHTFCVCVSLTKCVAPPLVCVGTVNHDVATFVDNAVIDLGIDTLYDATLVEVGPAVDGSGLHVVIEMSGEGAPARKQLAASLVLCAERCVLCVPCHVRPTPPTSPNACTLNLPPNSKDVDAVMFRAINGCGLVYDGRLVVNHRFRTTQHEILGAGPLVKFSRRYRSKHLLQDFNSREVGAAVATSLLQELDPLAVPLTDTIPEEYATGPGALPRFGLPLITKGQFPGGLHYVDIKV